METQDSRVPGGDGEGGVAIRVRGLRKLYGDVEAVRGTRIMRDLAFEVARSTAG